MAPVSVSDSVHAKAVTRLSEQLADLHASRASVRIVGSGTWLHGGRPVRAEHRIDTRETAGILAYEPEDLVITVGAGTTLDEIDEATKPNGQWLAIDPPGSVHGTIGATLATATSGPLALGAGRIRDLVLGMTVLQSDGTPIRAGANVVKNVAGFDLVRLFTGAWGTLGPITSASFRLHARPAVDETIGIAIRDSSGGIERGDELRDAERSLAELPSRLGLKGLQYLALEVLSPALARAVLDQSSSSFGWTLLARVGGNRERVDALKRALGAIGDAYDVDGDAWNRLRDDDALVAPNAPQHGTTRCAFRTGAGVSRMGETIAATLGALRASGITDAALRASPHSGTVRVLCHTTPDVAETLVSGVTRATRTTIWEELPPNAWPRVPSAATDPVSIKIRDVFDPHRQFNPSIFGDPYQTIEGLTP